MPDASGRLVAQAGQTPASTMVNYFQEVQAMGETQRSRTRLQSVSRALQLHDLIAAEPGHTPQELAARIGLGDKTLWEYLARLTEDDWILLEDHRYYVNPERRLTGEDLRVLGDVIAALNAHEGTMSEAELTASTGLTPTRIRAALLAGVHAGLLHHLEGRYATAGARRTLPPRVEEVLSAFTTATGHDAALATLYQGRLVLTHLRKPEGRISLLEGVTTDAAHATSAGHSLLHWLTRHQRQRYFQDSGMPRFTQRTPTTLNQLELLLPPSKTGIYTAEGQFDPQGACLALGLRSGAPDGRCVALTTSVYVRDLTEERKALTDDLISAAALLAPMVGPIPLTDITEGLNRMAATRVPNLPA